MKRLCIIVMLLLGASAWAQAPVQDSTGSKGRELDGKESRNRERNLIGVPVYYDTLGNVIGSEASRQGIANLPRHHYFNRLSNDYCSWFVETDGWFGGDVALGGNCTYLPERWGFYGKGLWGVRRNYASAGAALRLSDCGDAFDWQMYGGVVVSTRPGVEVGFRMAAPRHNSAFCWESMTVGMAQVGRSTFFTFGMSLGITATVASILLLWW